MIIVGYEGITLQKIILLLFVILFVSGCGYVVPTLKQRQSTLQSLVADKNLTIETIKTKKFNLFSVRTSISTCRGAIVNLYIEGDGLSWETPTVISNNPTPINPLGLKLFLQDNHKCKVYLARPCQYISSSMCSPKYWTSHRFSSDVIKSFKEALDKIKKDSNSLGFNLFGYSGGGAVATILTAKRSDILTLVTIAGNLNIEYWANKHHITPLYGSLNPANFSEKLNKIHQIHLIGSKDYIVDIGVFKSYIKKFKDKRQISYKIFKSYDHHGCWEKNWKHILKDMINK